MTAWVYLFGEVAGRAIKIGSTKRETTAERRVQVDRDQMNTDKYVQLAAVRGSNTDESALHDYFAAHRLPMGSRREYYEPVDELTEYVLWLREQWFVSHDDTESGTDAAVEHSDRWLPGSSRRVPRPAPDPSKFFQDYEQFQGPLAGTHWSWMPNLDLSSFQDYFTPESLVQCACEAMGGIDLDAASHYLANRRFHRAGIRIDDYFHVNKSAFTHDWHGRVWLNPPYGENEQWFKRAEQMFDEGRIEQLCMLSPAYAFITKVAQPMVRRSSAAVLLSPTPEFHNPGNPLKTGTNLPHVIFYWGGRVDQFTRAFGGVGIPFEPRWP